MSFTCEHCDIILSSVSALNYHKKNTNSCLLIQGKTKDIFNCKICNNEFISKSRMENHLRKCIAKQTEQQKQLQLEHLEKEQLKFKALEHQHNILESKFNTIIQFTKPTIEHINPPNMIADGGYRPNLVSGEHPVGLGGARHKVRPAIELITPQRPIEIVYPDPRPRFDIKDFRTKGTYITHVSMGKVKAKYALGRYNIEDMFDSFAYEGYSGLAEKPQYYAPIIADIDFKLTKPIEHTNKHILDTVLIYQSTIKQIIAGISDEDLTCLVLEKPLYSTKQNDITYYKHGFHLHFPRIFILAEHQSNELIPRIRDQIRINKTFSDIGLDEKVVDDCSKKNWLMYGCYKDVGMAPYLITKIYNHKLEEITLLQALKDYTLFDMKDKKIPLKTIEDINKNIARIMSVIPFSRPEKELKLGVLYEQFTNKEEKKYNSNHLYDQLTHDENMTIAKQLLPLLSSDRADEREDWLKVGWILYNMSDGSDDGLDLWKDFSERCPDKYNEDVCIYQWSKMTNKDIGLGSLKYYAKMDNPDLYKKYTTLSGGANKPSGADGTGPNEYQRIKAIPKKKRTPEEQTCIDTINNKIIKNQVELLFDTSQHKCTFLTDEWVTPKIIDQNTKCIVIKAGLGKGKTTASVEHINTTDYDKIFVLTPRKTFAKSIADRLNKETNIEFSLYLDLKGNDHFITKPFVVIQVESLYRLDLIKDNEKVLLLCDEIESILFQMTIGKTHSNNHMANLEAFEHIFNSSSKIIALDAFVSNKTLDTLKLMNIPFDYYNFTMPLEQRTCLRLDSQEVFENNIIRDLQEGKKLYIFCSSNNKLVNRILPLIKTKCPTKKIIEYHSKFTSINLSSINDTWKECDAVATTSTITVGCNFDLPNVFDKAYVLANASSKNLVRDIFQSSYRVRHFKDKQLVYYLDSRNFGGNLPVHMKEIRENVLLKKSYLSIQYESQHQLTFDLQTPEWITELVIKNEFEQNMSIINLNQLFERYLKECHYEEQYVSDELVQEDFKDNDDTIIIDDSFEYEEIPSISTDDAILLMKKRVELTTTKLEEATLEKYYFQIMLVVINKRKLIIQKQLWHIYLEYGKGKFRNLAYEKGYNEGTLRLCDIMNDVYPEVSRAFSLRVEMIKEICTTIGIRHTNDLDTVSKEKLDSCVEWFKDNSVKIHTVFNIRNQSKPDALFDSRAATNLINKVFNKWSYTSIKAGTRSKHSIDGNVVYTTPYHIKSKTVDAKKNWNVNVYDNLKPKKVRQTNKKVVIKDDETGMPDF